MRTSICSSQPAIVPVCNMSSLQHIFLPVSLQCILLIKLASIRWQRCLELIINACDCADPAAKKAKDFSRRTSSGNWINDRVTWKEELNYKKAMGYI